MSETECRRKLSPSGSTSTSSRLVVVPVPACGLRLAVAGEGTPWPCSRGEDGVGGGDTPALYPEQGQPCWPEGSLSSQTCALSLRPAGSRLSPVSCLLLLLLLLLSSLASPAALAGRGRCLLGPPASLPLGSGHLLTPGLLVALRTLWPAQCLCPHRPRGTSVTCTKTFAMATTSSPCWRCSLGTAWYVCPPAFPPRGLPHTSTLCPAGLAVAPTPCRPRVVAPTQ